MFLGQKEDVLIYLIQCITNLVFRCIMLLLLFFQLKNFYFLYIFTHRIIKRVNKYNHKLLNFEVMTKWLGNNYFFVIKFVYPAFMKSNQVKAEYTDFMTKK